MWDEKEIYLESALISEAGYCDTVGDDFNLSIEKMSPCWACLQDYDSLITAGLIFSVTK